MESLIHHYARRLEEAGLVDAGDPLIGFVDDTVTFNRKAPETEVLEPVFDRLAINSLLLARPAEPYRSILDHLTRGEADTICPLDCETRTFLHDLPVARRFDADTLHAALKQRKSLIIPGRGIVTSGTVSPEQAFVTFSSVCFAAFVKFHLDLLLDQRMGKDISEGLSVLERVRPHQHTPPAAPAPPLATDPFADPDTAMAAMAAAGRRMLAYRLVDSFFGNISCRVHDTILISQTGSSLDYLEGCIDPCPLDGSSCAGLTASSELSAHRAILAATPARCILHGHPKFAVIMSMVCDHADCTFAGECHRRCPHDRDVAGIPVVSGEVGTGKYGLCHTVPPALADHPGVIVYGHGVFTTGRADFNEALQHLMDIENACRERYFDMLGEIR
jgi:ribulose-5-phosphate 4-epimerase/fuculose-1-phosphate aldolase